MGESVPPDRSFGHTHYNGAQWFVPVALRDLCDALDLLPVVALYCGTRLSDWFAQHRPELREGRYPHTPEQFRDTDALMRPSMAIEEKIEYSGTVAILMAVIDLESQINVFIHENFAAGVSASVESLQLGKKFTLAYALHGKPYVGTHVQEALGELIGWRNEYAHGKWVGRPKSLLQTLSPRLPGMVHTAGDVARETTHLLQRYFLVRRGLDSIDSRSLGAEREKDYREVEETLARIARTRFDDDGQPSWYEGQELPRSLGALFQDSALRERLRFAGVDMVADGIGTDTP